MLSIALALVMAAADADLAPGECPAGKVLVPGSLVMKTLPNGDTEGTWECKLAQKQLSDMGTGRVDTGTGFDGGVGPTSAVATPALAGAIPSALAAAIPGMTPEKMERYSKSAGFNAAAEELAKAANDAQTAQAKVDALREKQKGLSIWDSTERQKMQIEIASAEQQRSAARGAERIATERIKRIIIVMDATEIMKK